MTIDEMIAVLQASKEGKKIQCYWHGATDGKWSEGFTGWDFTTYDYRVKPEPIEVEVWVHPTAPNVIYREMSEERMVEHGYTKKKFREVIE